MSFRGQGRQFNDMCLFIPPLVAAIFPGLVTPSLSAPAPVVPAVVTLTDPNTIQDYETFKAEFGRVNTAEEEIMRENIFLSNLQLGKDLLLLHA